jgi:thiol-disulfide isomerase/thioredoxin
MKAKPKIKKRDVIELAVVVIIFAVIFLTGSQAEVFGRIQQVILKTGIMNARTLEADEYYEADYSFQLVDANGQIVNAADLKGKTVFMNIWATWCPPCVAEMPSINALYQDFKDNDKVAFIMISQDQKFEKAIEWIERKGLDLPIYQLRTLLPSLYDTGVVPSTFVISPDGKVVVKKTGLANYDTNKFRKLLTEL